LAAEEVVMAKTDGVRRATGRDRAEWFALLDGWGAAGRPYREIAGWLTGEHALSRWWAQKLVVEYEQARGVRAPGVRRDGTFEVSASKTVAAPAERALDAFVDARLRRKWLPDAKLRLVRREAGKSARFDWDGGGTRVSVTVAAKGPSKATVTVAHDRIPAAREAETRKKMWRERLGELKSLLEARA
jgi:hypothetical protein